MKKVLSVALASAMVLGMGVNAFADISYNTGAGTNEVSLKDVKLDFDGSLVITDKDGVAIDSTDEDAEFRPGDVIYMPLYGYDSVEYVGGSKGTEAEEEVKNVKIFDGVDPNKNAGSFSFVQSGDDGVKISNKEFAINDGKYKGRTVKADTAKAYAKKDGHLITGYKELYGIGYENIYVTYTLKAEEGKKATTGDKHEVNDWTYGQYQGEIGKNWSINFTEKSENFVEKASFYKAKASDKKLTAGAWYIKVELKDLFDSVDDGEVYYKVYVTDNNDRSETTRVYVKGDISNEDIKYVDFEWTNNANVPAVWHVKKGENGTAVFDFEDKAFFTVKMYSEEKMYLDLSTAYQKAVAGEYDAEFDNFFKFQGTNANFSRTGELIIESNDPNLFVYEIDSDNNLYPVDAKYVKDYQITHTNDKINGYVFNTKTLGNYVLSVDKLEVEEETEAPEEKPADNNTSSDKENPNTGANDFVGVAVALAVVSVAGAGALALKK